MTDIVEWLRAEAELIALPRLEEAADEIERLRKGDFASVLRVGVQAENERLRAEIERLRESLRDIASMHAEDLYYSDGQEHDNAAAAYATQALKPQ